MDKLKALLLAAVVGLSLASVAPTFGDTRPIDINTASAEELVEVNGIGPSKAQAIVEHRQQHGTFASVDDLREVNGIGSKLLERLRPQLTAGDRRKKEAK